MSALWVPSTALILSVSLLGCGQQVRPDEPSPAVQAQLEEVLRSNQALTGRIAMLAERLARVEDRIALQESVRPSVQTKLPIVKVVPKPIVEEPEQNPITITQDDLRNRERIVASVPPLSPKKRRPSVSSRQKSMAKKQSKTQRARVMVDPEDMVRQATAAMEQGNMTRAMTYVRAVQSGYPRSPMVEFATLVEGRVHFERGESKQALSAFKRLRNQFPKGVTVPDALFMEGVVWEQLGEREKAMKVLSRLKNNYPTTEAGRRAAAALVERADAMRR